MFRAPLCPPSSTKAPNAIDSNHLYNTLELLMMGIVVPETCWASNKICNKKYLLYLVGILFPHIKDDARSKSHEKYFHLPVAFEIKLRCAFRSSRRWAITTAIALWNVTRCSLVGFTNMFVETYCLQLHGSVVSKYRWIISALERVTFHHALSVIWSHSSSPSWQSFLLYNMTFCIVCNCQLN